MIYNKVSSWYTKWSPLWVETSSVKITKILHNYWLHFPHCTYNAHDLFCNLKFVKLENAEEPEIKLPTSAGSSKKQESSRKTSISALLTIPKPLTVWITINWKILQEMGIPDHLTCLLRNLYDVQDATVRTGHGTTDWFQIGKGNTSRLYIVTLFI